LKYRTLSGRRRAAGTSRAPRAPRPSAPPIRGRAARGREPERQHRHRRRQRPGHDDDHDGEDAPSSAMSMRSPGRRAGRA
jgi:hypothetical protein